MKQLISLAFFSVVAFQTLCAQLTYSRVFNLSENVSESGFQILSHNDKYYILLGLIDVFTYEDYAGILTLDYSGQLVWSNTYYNGAQSADPTGPEGMVIIDDKIYIAGTYQSSLDNFDLDLALLHFDTTGHLNWQRGYESPVMEYATSLQIMQDSSLILLGLQKYELGGANSYDAILQETDLDGNQLSSQIVNIDYTIFTRELKELSDGSLLVAGITCLPGTQSCASQKSAIIVKMSRSGEIIWTTLMPQTESPPESFQVIELDNGRLAASWYRDTFPPGGITYQYPCAIYFLDSLGDQEYYVPFDAPYDKQIANLRLLSNGDILGIGTTNGFPDHWTEGAWLFRMTQQGELLWEQKIMDYRFESTFGWLYDGMETPDGGIIAVGFIENTSAQRVDVWVVQLTADGCYLENSDDCTDNLLMITPIDIAIPSPKGIRIFPNPAHDQVKLILNIDEGQQAEIKIFDVFGQSILLTKTSTQETDIDLSNFPVGTYFVLARSKNQSFSTRIIKMSK